MGCFHCWIFFVHPTAAAAAAAAIEEEKTTMRQASKVFFCKFHFCSTIITKWWNSMNNDTNEQHTARVFQLCYVALVVRTDDKGKWLTIIVVVVTANIVIIISSVVSCGNVAAVVVEANYPMTLWQPTNSIVTSDRSVESPLSIHDATDWI